MFGKTTIKLHNKFIQGHIIWFVKSNSVEVLSKEITKLHAKEEFQENGGSEHFRSNSVGYISQKRELFFFKQSLVIYVGLSESRCKPSLTELLEQWAFHFLNFTMEY